MSAQRISRPYQLDIFEKAKTQNVIACLPTGTGKTQIACLLIKHLGDEVAKDYTSGGKRMFFLVPQKVLVRQQAQEIRHNTSLEVGELSGDLDVDSWPLQKWKEKLDEFEVFVMTHQILENLLIKSILSIDQISLVIFDEAHHASEKRGSQATHHVYKRILDFIRDKLKDKEMKDQPRLLGLTASVINNRSEGEVIIADKIKKLEHLFLNAKCYTVSEQEIGKFKTNAKAVVWIVPSPRLTNLNTHRIVELTDILTKAIVFFEDDMKSQKGSEAKRKSVPIDSEEMKKSLTSMIVILEGMGIWMGQEIAGLFAQELRETSKLIQEYNEVYARFLDGMAVFFDTFKSIVGDMISGVDEKEKLLTLACLRPRRLLQILENYSCNSKFRGIIFVQQRLEAMVLSSWIGKVSQVIPSLKFVKTDYLVGYSSRPGFVDKSVESAKKKQEATLLGFRSGKVNLLVSTSVLEEGLDVPECNCVIRYELPKTFRSWQQSKGRARAKIAHFYLMAQEGVERQKIIDDMHVFLETDKVIQNHCLIDKKKRDIEEGNAYSYFSIEDPEEEALKALTVVEERTGAVITHDNAISRVHQYLQQISNDLFLHDEIKDVEGGCYCLVRLPMNTVIREDIIGKVMSDKRNAKKAAYLEICRLLKERGVLNERLEPINKKDQAALAVKKLHLNLPDKEEVEKGQPKPGTKKRRLNYEKTVNCLLEDHVEENSIWFLYHISLSVSNSRIKIGILVPNRLPLERMNTSFDVFKKTTAVEVKFVLMSEVCVSQEQFLSLSNFHEHVFFTGLMFNEKDISCNFSESKSKVVVVPVDLDKKSIDYSYVSEFQRRMKDPSFETPSNPNDFLDFLVMVTYRENYSPVKVKHVCHDKNCYSPFDDPTKAPDFISYYKEKYRIGIGNPHSPLLECEYSDRLATLRPRAGKALTVIHLIPELVHRLPLEASLFEDLTCIPAVLYRLNQLLKAEFFRTRLCQEFGIGTELVPPSSFVLGKLKFPEIGRVVENKVYVEEESRIEVSKDMTIDECWVFDSSPESSEVSSQKEEVSSDDDEIPADFLDSESEDMELEFEQNDWIYDPKACPGDTFFWNGKRWLCKYDSLGRPRLSHMPNTDSDIDVVRSSINYLKRKDIDSEGNFNQVIGHELLRKFKSEVSVTEEPAVLQPPKKCKELIELCKKATETLKEMHKNFSTFEVPDSSTEVYLKGKTTPEEAFSVVKSFIQKSTATLYSSYGVLPSLMIEVFTASSARDFVDSERLETLGDSFLKWTVSDFLYHKTSDMPELMEGHLTQIKGQLVSNYNLSRLSKEKAFCSEVTIEELNPKFNWLPPGFVLRSEDREGDSLEERSERQTRQLKKTTQLINDKVIADSVEALIGAVILCRGVFDAAKFVTKIGIDVGFVESASSRLHWLEQPAFRLDSRKEVDTLFQRHMLFKYESILGYEFHEKAFFVQAVTHPSDYSNRVTGGNQKLEFLGDAVLDYLVTRFLFEKKKNRNHFYQPGQLTDLRSALTNNAFLGTTLVKYKLHKSISCYSPEITKQINLFTRDYQSLSGSSVTMVGSYIVIQDSLVEVPKILGDFFESIIAAVYLDSGRDLDRVWTVFYGLVKQDIQDFLTNIPKNPVRMVFETDKQAKFGKPTSKDDNECKKVQVVLHYKNEVFEGRGSNGKLAKIHAAVQALRRFNLFISSTTL